MQNFVVIVWTYCKLEHSQIWSNFKFDRNTGIGGMDARTKYHGIRYWLGLVPSHYQNYRPISLLSSLSKVFEKVVFNQLYNYFTCNKLFYSSQYGFRQLHSTELASLELVDRITKYIDEGKLPLSVFLDLSKAFDTIDHRILLQKLKYYGVSDTPLKWLRSYLSDRKQCVYYEGVFMGGTRNKRAWHSRHFIELRARRIMTNFKKQL